jgi:Protein of unknown function (DUF2591)
MKIKTSELTGVALDWAVAKCEAEAVGAVLKLEKFLHHHHIEFMCFSTDWSQGSPIIEREGISSIFCSGDLGEPRKYWVATIEQQSWEWGYGPYHEQDEDKSIRICYKKELHIGPTPLIAAMRCYVSSKLGDTVEVPDELCQ